MIARVSSFEGVNVEEAEKTTSEANALIRPLVENLAGYQGQVDLVASSGRMLSITFFDSEENAQAAEPTFEQMPRQLHELFARWEGRRVSVERYNVLADERT